MVNNRLIREREEGFKKKKPQTEHEQSQPYHQHHQFEYIDFGWCNGDQKQLCCSTTNSCVALRRHQRGAWGGGGGGREGEGEGERVRKGREGT